MSMPVKEPVCYLMVMDYEIRDAKTTDAEAVAHLYTDGWRFAYQGLIPQNYIDSLNAEARVSYWEKTLSEPIHLRKSIRKVACDENRQVLGVISFGADREPESGAAEIYTLYARPEKAGQGVGYSLMNHAVVELQKAGYQQVILWVLQGNDLAQNFYTRQGFTFTGKTREDVIEATVLCDLQMSRPLMTSGYL